ncbi:MAG: hypothetical protein JWN40_2665 [Phycisphaerales bacterium]|nr:hypothetical protein [Phycisphaerales bacterium]
MSEEGKPTGSSSRRLSYEIVPGSIFPVPKGFESLSFTRKVKLQRRAEQLFSDRILKRLGIASRRIRADIARGGWEGSVSASTQIIFSEDASVELLKDYAAALGLLWRQDAVAISRLHPDGKCLVIRIVRVDGKRLNGAQIDRFYRILYENDQAKQATIGFTEHDGSMLFVNLPGGMSDKAFETTLVTLAEEHLSADVFLDFARADFELESTDWSNDHGEGYRQRLRETGRSDLLDWIENTARHEAERFLAKIKPAARKARKGPSRRNRR